MLDVTFRGVVLATGAMLVRNAIILGLIAPSALLSAAPTLVLMLAGAAAATFVRRSRTGGSAGDITKMSSPFSLTAALKFGVIFLVLQVGGTLAQRAFGQTGFYIVSAVGGLVSSAGAVASAANLAASGNLDPSVAGSGAIIASLASAAVNLPLVVRIGRTPALTRRVTIVIVTIIVLGVAGVLLQPWVRR